VIFRIAAAPTFTEHFAWRTSGLVGCEKHFDISYTQDWRITILAVRCHLGDGMNQLGIYEMTVHHDIELEQNL